MMNTKANQRGTRTTATPAHLGETIRPFSAHRHVTLTTALVTFAAVLVGGCSVDRDFLSRNSDAAVTPLPLPMASGGAGGGGTGGATGTAGTGAVAQVDGGAAGAVDATGEGSPASATSLPRYLFVFYTPHGTVLDAWRPTATKDDFTLSPILQPLERYKSQLTIIDGLDNVTATGTPAQTHVDGPKLLLTARASNGASIDTLFGSGTAFSSIVAGVQVQPTTSARGAVWVNYGLGGAEVRSTDSPLHVQDRLFGGLPNAPRVTVDSTDYLAAGRAHAEVIATAFSFNLMGAATLLWSGVNGQTAIAGTGQTLHGLAEASGTSPAREQFIAQQTVFAQEFAAIIARFAAISLGQNTTLLDRSLIMWISETGEASSHSGLNIPVVLAGGLGGRLRTGRYLQYAARTQGDLLLTIAWAMGTTTFGDPAIAVAPLSELIAP